MKIYQISYDEKIIIIAVEENEEVNKFLDKIERIEDINNNIIANYQYN